MSSVKTKEELEKENRELKKELQDCQQNGKWNKINACASIGLVITSLLNLLVLIWLNRK